MSVFGSLFTAVSGLEAQSSSISMISNNIANVSTVGYKRTDSDFASLVTTSGRSTAYSPGSVRAIQSASVTEQGILQQTSSETDVAISGNGFFVVTGTTDGTTEPLYTRSGSFSEDSSGILVNSSGYYLMGWPLDQDGNLPASQADISSLSVVDVSFLGGLTLPTTTAEMSMNLQADEDNTTYPADYGFDPDFSRSITVYDSLGEGHDLTACFKKIESPTTSVTGTNDISEISGTFADDAAFDGTETFTIEVDGVTTTITLDGGLSDMLTDLNSIVDADGNALIYAVVDETTGCLDITARNIGDEIILTDGVGTPLALGTKLGLSASIGTTTAPVSEADADLLTSLDPDNDVNTEGWWVVEYKTSDNTIVERGLINFTGDGGLNAETTTAGTVPITLSNIDWGNGSTIQTITFDLSGFTQFSGQYNVISSAQNGAELGLRTGVTIDEEGYVVAQFSNGQSKKIYKLALATFANADGLTELSGNVYRESDTSGSYNLREADSGGAGTVNSGSLESSNVDLADEFSKMIITQRAYSANTKVISTADDMMEELLRLR